jgi:hypothetical protein
MHGSTGESQRAERLLLTALRLPHELPGLSDQDWELLVRVARRTRLLGRLESDLSTAGLLEHIPVRAATHLRAARNVITHRKTLVTWEVSRILWALGGLDSQIILLKGAAYVMASLPPERGRIFADVDLLVPEDVIGDIEQRLVERGWLRMPIHPYDDRYYRLWTHEIPPLRHRERGTEIDIHHRILPRTSRIVSDPAPLFAAARPLLDARLRVLAPCDMILHAMVHLFLDGDPDEGLRLRDLVDVHDLVSYHAAEPHFWSNLRERAHTLQLERVLYYGLHFTSQLLDTRVPPELLNELEDTAPWPVTKLMVKLMRGAILPEHPDHRSAAAAVSRWLIYVRAHWLRMPSTLLARHLAYKGWLRFRRVPGHIDLAQLDLRQQ